MHKDNTNKKKRDAKLWYLERSRNASQIREKVKKKSRKRRVTTRRRKKKMTEEMEIEMRIKTTNARKSRRKERNQHLPSPEIRERSRSLRF